MYRKDVRVQNKHLIQQVMLTMPVFSRILWSLFTHNFQARVFLTYFKYSLIDWCLKPGKLTNICSKINFQMSFASEKRKLKHQFPVAKFIMIAEWNFQLTKKNQQFNPRLSPNFKWVSQFHQFIQYQPKSVGPG